jgi:hypothetical protein
MANVIASSFRVAAQHLMTTIGSYAISTLSVDPVEVAGETFWVSP